MSTVVTPTIPPLGRDARVIAWVLASSLSRVGDVAWFIGLAWTAAHVAGPAGVGLVMGVSSVPRAAILLIGGAYADRLDARRTMVIANLARIAVLAVAILVVDARESSLVLLLVVAVVFGLVDGMYDPASGTMPRQLVRPEDLAAVSSMFQLGSRMATLIGAPLGGILVATGGLTWVMAFDAVSFAVIAVVLALVIKPRFALERSQGRSVRHDLVDGFSYLRRAANARTLTIALCGLNLFVGPVTAVGVVLRIKAEGWGAASPRDLRGLHRRRGGGRRHHCDALASEGTGSHRPADPRRAGRRVRGCRIRAVRRRAVLDAGDRGHRRAWPPPSCPAPSSGPSSRPTSAVPAAW